MVKQKINNKFFWLFVVILGIIVIMTLVYKVYYPSKETLFYQKDTLGNNVYFEDKAFIYRINSDEFIGYKLKTNDLKKYEVTLTTDILISKEEHLDYFEKDNIEYKNVIFESYPLHIKLTISRRLFIKESYHMLLSIYYDGYYIQSIVYYANEEIDINSENEVVELAKKYCKKLLYLYEENKEEIKINMQSIKD